MASAYSKLSGKKRDISGYRQLWLGADHLLLIESSRFQQSYRKFALRDIQGIVTTAKPSAVVMRIVLAVLAAAFLALAYVVDSTGGKATLAVIAAIPFAAMIADVARGPRCLCKLCTEVSTEILPLTRESAAREFVSKVAPAIESSQGGRLDVDAFTQNRQFPSPQPVRRAAVPSVAPLLAVLSLALLVNLVLLICGLVFKRPDLYASFVTLVFGETIVGFIVLRMLRDSPEEFAARSASALAMALSAMDMLLGIGLFSYFIYLTAETSKNGGDVNSLKWYQIPYIRYWTYYAVGWRAICGLATSVRFVALRLKATRARKTSAIVPAPPPVQQPPVLPPPFGGEPSL